MISKLIPDGSPSLVLVILLLSSISFPNLRINLEMKRHGINPKNKR